VDRGRERGAERLLVKGQVKEKKCKGGDDKIPAILTNILLSMILLVDHI
jgi:hypothetical protein